MRYSLISRDWIADCVEIMHEAYSAVSNAYKQTVNIMYVQMLLCVQDAVISLGGCDKTGKHL